jgi:hypothetical protein
MNADPTSGDPMVNSMSTRFGFGFERESSTNASTQQARGFFLKLLPELRENVTLTLCDSSYTHLVTFLNSHQDEVNSIKERIEPSSYSLDTAIRIFIHRGSAMHDELVSRLGHPTLKSDLVDQKARRIRSPVIELMAEN